MALTSHLMKTLERLVLHVVTPQVQQAQDPLQFGYQKNVGVEDAVQYLLHRTHTFLDRESGAVRILFIDISSAFNTIQPLCLKGKLTTIQVDPPLLSWITDYLTDRCQFVRLRTATSDMVMSSTGGPQETVLAPLLFTLYTVDFMHNTELCHVQKFSDDTAIVGCIRGSDEKEYRAVVKDFTSWCHLNHLQLQNKGDGTGLY